MLAIVGIGAILAFVVGDPLMQLMGRRSQRDQNPVVVETKYGKLKESDLHAMRSSRELVELFLQRVSAETISSQVRNNALDSRLADMMMQRWYETWKQQLMGRSSPAPEAAIVETLVLSKKAQQMGIVVSDRAINDFIKQVSDDSLTSEALERIISTLQSGRRVSAVRLFEAIRTEMLASKVSELFAQSLRDVPPAQRFDYFCRLNRRAKVEFAPLAVAEFVAQVNDPNPADLQAFFDKYKDRYADPASPEPGFKEPKRATFQYFKADFAKFKDEFGPKVSDAEIADYYEKQKEQFRATELPPEQPTDKPAEEPAADDASKTPDAPKPEEGKPEEKKTEPAPVEPTKPDASPEKPAADKPPEDTSPESKSSESRRLPSVRLVSVLLADDAQDEPAVTGGDEKAEPADKPAVEGPSLDSKDDSTSGEDQPKGEGAAEADKPADQPVTDAAEKKDDATAQTKPEPPKYEPLEKVKDQIRTSIAARKASERIGEIFDELTAEMRRYADEVDAYNARKGTDPNAAPPKPFPFAELAKKYGIEAKELSQVTAEEAAAEDLGQLQQRVRDPRSPIGMRSEPFTGFAFSDNFPTYRTDVLQDNDGNGYLFWKTEEKAAFVPSLDDVRDKVVRAWKMIKARELARKSAAEYAVQARTGGKPFKEAFANRPNLEVTETDWFSWMTMGNVPLDPNGNRPRLSTIEGVEHAGDAFMADVFNLSPGEVSVTTNEPQNTVYIVRLAEFEKPIDELRQDFASERRPLYMAVAMPDQRRIYDAWLKDVEKDAGVHWLREADTARRSRPVDEEPEGDAGY